jgi:glucose dehydrogenase
MRNWLDSATVRHLAAAVLLNVLTWALLALGTDVWDWRSLAASTIAILIPFVRRLAQPDLVTGVPLLDARNPKP